MSFIYQNRPNKILTDTEIEIDISGKQNDYAIELISYWKSNKNQIDLQKKELEEIK